MRLTIVTLAAIALVSCNKAEAPADTNADANAVDVNAVDANAAATPAAFQLNETTWTFTDKDGQAIKESIDASGNYIANAGDKHLDHGTSVIKDGKACFTSAMNKDGEVCWTIQAVEVGQAMETTSDKGEKLTVTRVAYEPMTMPAPAQ
ncbi:hypothetical protein [Sphingomonas daechungensis]|uniref:Lipoprotein n=1 Tax=Sphingomonas daechungensis TaxID=1176646 RepID=A0ABX6SZE5_9SPHN|nr:hypothetical protein [Sphingomonas daechungensis]QNP42947.1 hypothetical protein H9L15_13150 [Sphingomonas daechungensis]